MSEYIIRNGIRVPIENNNNWGISSHNLAFSTKNNAERNIANLQQYWEAYLKEPTAFTAVNNMALSLSKEYNIISDNQDLADIASNILDDLSYEIFILVRNAVIFGDGFAEIIRNQGGKFYSLKSNLNPLHFKIDDSGESKIYLYGENELKKSAIPEDSVLHIQLLPMFDTPYGLSLLISTIDSIKYKKIADDSISKAIARHGARRWNVIIKRDERGRYPDLEEFSRIANGYRNVEAKSELIHTDMTEVKELDKDGIPEVLNYQKFFRNNIAIGMGAPLELLGLEMKGSSYALAKEKRKAYYDTLNLYRKIIAKQLEEQLLNRILPYDVKVEPKPLGEEAFAERVKGVTPLLSTNVLTRNEIREYLGYSPENEEIVVDANENIEVEEKRKSTTEYLLEHGFDPVHEYNDAYEEFLSEYEKMNEELFEKIKNELK